MCDYVGRQRAGAGFFAMHIQETRADECKVQYMLERDDRAAICHHHNNVRTEAARCAIGMMMCGGCACAYLDAR